MEKNGLRENALSEIERVSLGPEMGKGQDTRDGHEQT